MALPSPIAKLPPTKLQWLHWELHLQRHMYI